MASDVAAAATSASRIHVAGAAVPDSAASTYRRSTAAAIAAPPASAPRRSVQIMTVPMMFGQVRVRRSAKDGCAANRAAATLVTTVYVVSAARTGRMPVVRRKTQAISRRFGTR